MQAMQNANELHELQVSQKVNYRCQQHKLVM